MKIKTKSIIALIATTICLIMILDFVSDSVIQTNFLQIEQTEVKQTIGRIQVAVSNSYTDLDNKLVSWSQLNSTYEFVQNLNDEYNETYLTVSSLANEGVNFVIFLDSRGNYLTGMGLNLTTLQQIPIPQNIITLVSSDNLIWNLTTVDSHTSGFVLSSGQPLLVASRPILMTNGARPARGVLIFARYYDSNEISALSFIMKSPMSMQLIGNWEKENSIPAGSFPSYIKPLNQQFTVGYDVIDDIHGQPLFVLGATMPRTVYDQGLNTIGYINEALLVAGVVFCITIVLIMEYLVLKRLGKLSDSVIKLRIHENSFQELPASGNDEITWLTLSINGLLQEIESQSVKLQKSERLSAIGELARQIGHDLRNPLASIKTAVYYLSRKGSTCSDEKRETMLEIIVNDISRSDKIINDLVEYSSDIDLELEQCCPKSLLAGVLSILQTPKNVEVVDRTLEEPKILADAGKIQRVFKVIIKNAFEAMPNGGTLEILSREEKSTVQITFSDTGTGIVEEILPKIFSPLITTKAQGMGLSLAICKRIVDCHDGKIDFESIINKGTTFSVTLPFKPKIQPADKRLMTKKDPLLHYNYAEPQIR
ncbi:MAG: CHASE4 domain-containing protein [Candidatus Bathyarchaeia archaeon]